MSGRDDDQPPLTQDQTHSLRLLAGMMIPASQEYGVPGADDPVIFDRIVAAANSDAAPVEESLKGLDDESRACHGTEFNALNETDRLAVAQSRAPHLEVVVSLVTQCYYSDGRVMDALGMAPRAPFPKGYEVEQGDWSLLDPVKNRPKLYREV